MERYTQRIVAQPMIKQQRKIVQIVLNILFGTRIDYLLDITTHWRTQGVFRHTNFNKHHRANISLFPYRSRSITASIHELKFYNQRHYAQVYGSILAEYLIETLAEYQLMHNIAHPVLCYVPSHPARLRERGYEPNILVLNAALESGLDSWVDFKPQALRKTRNTPKQSHVANRADRLHNPRGAFVVTKPSIIQGRDIVLFDNVFTTGATIHECARILKQAGAKRILCVTLAH